MDTVTRNLPDLPELQSVEAKNVSTLMFLLVYGGLYTSANILFLFQYQHLKQYIPLQGTVALALMTLVNLWLLVRAACSDYSWRTNEQGLVTRGLLRKRLIRWQEIKRATSDEPGTSGATIRLTTNDTTLKIPYNDKLLASVWQYLRQIGRTVDIDLPITALSFWDIIPDELPRELEWRRKRYLHPIITAGLTLSVIGGLIVLLWCGFYDNSFGIGMAAVLTLLMFACLRMMLNEALLPVTRFAVNDDFFEAENGWGRAQVAWSDVAHAEWFKLYLIVRTQNPRRVFWVPFQANDESSCQMILAIIRNLRSAANLQALTIPVALRQPEPMPGADSTYGTQLEEEKSVTLRYSPKELRLIGFLAGGFPALLILITLSRWPAIRIDDALILLIISAACAVAWLVAKYYSITADQTGIIKRYLIGHQSLHWDDVARVDAPKYQQHRNSRRRILKNAKGRTIMELDPSVGTADDREKFHRLVEHHLQHALQAPDQPKPWQARPWSPEN